MKNLYSPILTVLFLLSPACSDDPQVLNERGAVGVVPMKIQTGGELKQEEESPGIGHLTAGLRRIETDGLYMDEAEFAKSNGRLNYLDFRFHEEPNFATIDKNKELLYSLRILKYVKSNGTIVSQPMAWPATTKVNLEIVKTVVQVIETVNGVRQWVDKEVDMHHYVISGFDFGQAYYEAQFKENLLGIEAPTATKPWRSFGVEWSFPVVKANPNNRMDPNNDGIISYQDLVHLNNNFPERSATPPANGGPLFLDISGGVAPLFNTPDGWIWAHDFGFLANELKTKGTINLLDGNKRVPGSFHNFTLCHLEYSPVRGGKFDLTLKFSQPLISDSTKVIKWSNPSLATVEVYDETQPTEWRPLYNNDLGTFSTYYGVDTLTYRHVDYPPGRYRLTILGTQFRGVFDGNADGVPGDNAVFEFEHKGTMLSNISPSLCGRPAYRPPVRNTYR